MRTIALILENSRKISKVKIDSSKDDFSFKSHSYRVNPRKVYLLRGRPCLIYFEGFSEPVSHSDIKVWSEKESIFISSKEIHDFASKRILSVLLRSRDEDLTFLLLFAILFLSIISIIVNIFI